MSNIYIGSKIRELRKKKGITQEQLASVLSVSPQAVSKWESSLTYPDMEMMPVIAAYFEVSMDILFGYDVRELKAKIQKIIEDAWVYLYDEYSQVYWNHKRCFAGLSGQRRIAYGASGRI